MIVSQNSKDVIKIFQNIKDIPISTNSDDEKLNIFMCPINARNFDYNITLSILTAFLTFASFFMLHDTGEAIEALIIGFSVSPYGVPMAGETVIAFLEIINKKIISV